MSPFLPLFKLLLPSLFSVPHFPSSFPSSFCLLFSSHSTFALSFEVHFPLLFKPNLPPHQSTWLAAFTEGNCWTSKKSNQELSFLKNHSHVLRRLRLFHLLLRETGKENPGNLFWIVISQAFVGAIFEKADQAHLSFLHQECGVWLAGLIHKVTQKLTFPPQNSSEFCDYFRHWDDISIVFWWFLILLKVKLLALSTNLPCSKYFVDGIGQNTISVEKFNLDFTLNSQSSKVENFLTQQSALLGGLIVKVWNIFLIIFNAAQPILNFSERSLIQLSSRVKFTNIRRKISESFSLNLYWVRSGTFLFVTLFMRCPSKWIFVIFVSVVFISRPPTQLLKANRRQKVAKLWSESCPPLLIVQSTKLVEIRNTFPRCNRYRSTILIHYHNPDPDRSLLIPILI